ncbi:hypothetical protein RB599_006105 [Gaeumannomyces hyphopodioides]
MDSRVDVESSDASTSITPTSLEKQAASTSAPSQDSPEILVWWDEPEGEDPANPLNWSSRKRWLNILTVSLISFLVPLVSTMLAPAVPLVMADLGTDSSAFATFVVSIFVLGFACGPLVLAPLSELYGRVPVYNATNVLLVAFTAACALAPSAPALLAFRFLSGFVGVATITAGSGTIADLMPRERRGRAVSIWSVGTVLGPTVGPIIGGKVAATAGWRWMFWTLAILVVATSLGFAVFRETYAPVLLERKAANLRKETGNPHYQSKLAVKIPPDELFKRSILRPSRLLLLCPLVTVLCSYVALLYGTLYLLFATYSFAFVEVYGFSTFAAGLVFLPGGLGTLLGLLYLGIMSDWNLQRRAAAGKTLTPEDRLPLFITLPGALTFPTGLFMYGWGIDGGVHWMLPLVGTAVTGFGSILIFAGIQTYLIDAFEQYAASAVGANAVLRGLAGALLPLSGLGLYRSLGWGWGNALLGFLTLVTAPIPCIVGIYGAKLRALRVNQVEL